MTTSATEQGRQSVADTLLGMITNGDIRAGDWIRESEIARQLGVSRTPVRDALRQLAGSGVLALEPNRGARVRSYTAEEIEQIYRARSVVEPYVVAAAVPQMTAENISQLQQLSCRMREVSRDETRRRELAPLNNEFHKCYINASKSPLAPTAVELMVPLIVSKVMVTYDPHGVALSMAHHDELIMATEMQDPDWASATMRSHILSGLNHFKKATADTQQ